jgi:hypothetical protein
MLQYQCQIAGKYLTYNVHCNALHSSCNTSVHQLWRFFPIKCSLQTTSFEMKYHCPTALKYLPYNFILTQITQAAITEPPAVRHFKYNIHWNALHSNWNTSDHLMWSIFHIMFRVMHFTQTAIPVTTCCEVSSIQFHCNALHSSCNAVSTCLNYFQYNFHWSAFH